MNGAVSSPSNVATLYSGMRDNVRLVVIDLGEEDDTHLIFETLNAPGIPLLAADLVKNAVLYEIQTALVISAREVSSRFALTSADSDAAQGQ